MSDDKTPAAKEKLDAAGLVDRLLAYASSPWKAAFVIVAIVVCGAGYLVWSERARIADYVLSKANETAKLNEESFVTDAPRLLRETRGDYALLVEVNLNDNTMTDRIGMDTDGNRWTLTPGPQQALQPASSMPLLVKFLSNEVACMDTATAINDDIKTLAAKGYARLCFVAVPPILGVGAGGLMVVWKQAPLPALEQRASYAMKAAALRFATW